MTKTIHPNMLPLHPINTCLTSIWPHSKILHHHRRRHETDDNDNDNDITTQTRCWNRGDIDTRTQKGRCVLGEAILPVAARETNKKACVCVCLQRVEIGISYLYEKELAGNLKRVPIDTQHT